VRPCVRPLPALLALLVPLARAVELPEFDQRQQEAGAFSLTVSNQGVLGNPGQNWDRRCEPGVLAVPLEHPRGSGASYLYQTALWIGARVPQADGGEEARASVGEEGWARDVHELHPGTDSSTSLVESSWSQGWDCFGRGIFDADDLADLTITATFSDTLASSFGGVRVFDPVDHDHLPLGVEVVQVSRQWAATPDDDACVTLELTLRNIGEHELRSPYVGLFVDADVGAVAESHGQVDDLAGFRRWIHPRSGGDSLEALLACFFDDDGRPHDVGDGTDFSAPAALGVLPLSWPEGAGVGFNWWSSNSNPDADYGPAWAFWSEHPEHGLDWTTLYGTPLGDARKYELLRNGEIDPDMALVALDRPLPDQVLVEDGVPVAARSWNPSSVSHEGSSDVRGLLSVGPLGEAAGVDALGRRETVFPPGAEARVAFAFVLGDSLHRACCPQDFPAQGGRIDPSLHDFSSLERRAARVLELAARGWTGLPRPPRLWVERRTGRDVALRWRPLGDDDDVRYELKRRSAAGADTTLLAACAATAFVDTLPSSGRWRYAVRALDPDGRASGPGETSVDVDLPELLGVAVAAGDGRLELDWISSGGQARLELRRRDDTGGSYGPPATLDSLVLADGTHIVDGLGNWTRHEIRLTPADADGLLGPPGDWRIAIPHPPLEGLRLVQLASTPSVWPAGEARRRVADAILASGLPIDLLEVDPADLDAGVLANRATVWFNLDRDLRGLVMPGMLEIPLYHHLLAGGRCVCSGKLSAGGVLDPLRGPVARPAEVFAHALLQAGDSLVDAELDLATGGLAGLWPWPDLALDAELASLDDPSGWLREVAAWEPSDSSPNQAFWVTHRWSGSGLAALDGQPAAMRGFHPGDAWLVYLPLHYFDLASRVALLDAGFTEDGGSAPCWPGDADGDGAVDAADVLALAAHWEQAGPARPAGGCGWEVQAVPCGWSELAAGAADGNGDGVVDEYDLDCVVANYGRAAGAVFSAPPAGAGAGVLLAGAALAGVAPPVRARLERRLRELLGLAAPPVEPARFGLAACAPNPFNPSTRIEFELAADGPARLAVFDLLGRRVATLFEGEHAAGRHAAWWHGLNDAGRAVASGVYVARLESGGRVAARKLLLVK